MVARKGRGEEREREGKGKEWKGRKRSGEEEERGGDKRKGRERNQKGSETKHTFQGHTTNDLLPPTRPHLLKIPPPSNSPLSWEFINGLVY